MSNVDQKTFDDTAVSGTQVPVMRTIHGASLAQNLQQKASANAWDVVQKARDKDRPHPEDFIQAMVDGFIEFHGDRRFGDDPAVIGGLGWFAGRPVTVIGIRKGRTLSEKTQCNFGMPHPEGYRKALRLMKQAGHFGRPILSFVDTAGAYCDIESEERGQAQAIAENLIEMSQLPVPVLTVITGEGGSGGALALAVCDRLFMLENSVFSVITPEGCASILFKDAKLAKEAAQDLKMTAVDLIRLKVADELIPEPERFTIETMQPVVKSLRRRLEHALLSYCALPAETLLNRRYDKFRKIGSLA
jgi:acetyl-CoA carboxylase carboxyl transferase alpha subunit